MKRSAFAAACLLAASPALAAGSKTYYEITFYRSMPDLAVVSLDYKQRLPGAERAHETMKEAMRRAASFNNSTDIMGTIFLRDEMVRRDGYEPQWVYRADSDSIKPFSP